jgi:hypothetical protein
MNGRLLLAAAAGLLLILMCVTWSLHRHQPHAHPGHTAHPAGSSTSARPFAARRSAQLTAGEVNRLLPFPPGQIAAAAQLAADFTATYTTHRYKEPPAAYVQRLAPMISPQLRPAIERAAGDPATLTQRLRTQEISTGQARAETIRSLGPTSITFLVAATEHIATTYAVRHDRIRYAVTVMRTSSGWQVYAVDLAATGDNGDTP